MRTTGQWLKAVWRPAPPTLRCGENEVHLWREWLNRPPGEWAELLAPEERERAARFKFPEHAARFTVARGLLRTILARYEAVEPADLQFVAGPHGKPALVGQTRRFNLSHSGGVMLLAIAERREVGVDVERMRPGRGFDALAGHCFSAADAGAIEALAEPEKSRAFYARWVALEARMKAVGTGLGGGMKLGPPGRWNVVEFLPAPDYAGALAVEGWAVPEIRCWSTTALEPS